MERGASDREREGEKGGEGVREGEIESEGG
jgi:hypothetical protein